MDHPTIVIRATPGQPPSVQTNLVDPLAVATILGHAVAVWAQEMAQTRAQHARTAIVGPDGLPPPAPIINGKHPE